MSLRKKVVGNFVQKKPLVFIPSGRFGKRVFLDLKRNTFTHFYYFNKEITNIEKKHTSVRSENTLFQTFHSE